MEDAHIALDLGEDSKDLALFGVFDGHGGREVAAFCREHFAKELKRQIQKLKGPLAGELLGKALTQSFHSMDVMLESPEAAECLLKLRKAPSPQGPNEQTGASSTADGTKERDKSSVLTALQGSINSQMAEAKEEGSLTKAEAAKMMMKMALMRRLGKSQQAEPGASGLAVASGLAENVGCTAVCVLLSSTEIVCANAGDSRAVLCRNGRAVDLSEDHKPNSQTERDRIEAAGGRVHETPGLGARVQYRVNGNLNLSRSIGDLQYKKRKDLGPEQQIITATPDIRRVRITAEDEFIVLACDGVWDVKTSQQVCDFIRAGLARSEAIPVVIEKLLDDCIAEDPKETHGLGADNMTCVVVRIGRQATAATLTSI